MCFVLNVPLLPFIELAACVYISAKFCPQEPTQGFASGDTLTNERRFVL